MVSCKLEGFGYVYMNGIWMQDGFNGASLRMVSSCNVGHSSYTKRVLSTPSCYSHVFEVTTIPHLEN